MNSIRHAGFTLIEVMVALMIFAVLSVTLLTRLGDNIRAEHYLETKTITAVIAENVLTEMRIKKNWSAVANKKDTVEMTGIKWQVNIIVTDTPNENFRKVEVQVGPEQESSAKEGHVVSLVSYIGQY
jgi:general secretion pathway protein I